MGGIRDRDADNLETRVRARGRQPMASLLIKPSLCLQVIITAACYQQETSDLESLASLLLLLLLPLLPLLLGIKTEVEP